MVRSTVVQQSLMQFIIMYYYVIMYTCVLEFYINVLVQTFVHISPSIPLTMMVLYLLYKLQ